MTGVQTCALPILDAVDADAIARVAQRVVSSKLSVAALGLIGKLEGYDRLSGRFH